MQGPKVLLADDSLTIQKVISLTVEGLNLSLSVCKTKIGLEAHLAEDEFDIILLDYGFTEDISGIDYIKELTQKYPRIKILPLLGTLDADDQSALNKIGIEQIVVKPFDGNTLVGAIEALWGNSITNENQLGEKIEETNLPETNLSFGAPDSGEGLDWEQEVPGIINSYDHDDQLSDVPSVIKAADVQEQLVHDEDGENEATAITDMNEFVTPSDIDADADEEDPIRFPEGSDLAYPDDNLKSSVSDEMTSKLVSLDDLDPLGGVGDSEIEAHEDTSPDLNISELNESRVQEIENQIEEETKSDLWAPDEKNTRSSMPSLSKSEVRLIAQEVVQDYMKESLKRALKDIVPEIAEKIITKEIEKISERILRDDF